MALKTPSRSTVIVVLLVTTLGMTAALAYEAQQAARSHRATAENVLRDYAAFAAWELSRLGRQQVLTVINADLHAVERAVAARPIDALLDHPLGCGSCGATHRARTVFHAALPGARFEFAGETVDPSIADMLNASAAEVLRSAGDHTCPALSVMRQRGEPVAVLWRLAYDGNRPSAIVGLVTDAKLVASVFEKVVRTTPLLPPSLVQPGAAPNAAVVVRVTTPAGQPVFASAGEWSAYEAEETFQKDLGELKLAVAIAPDAAARLVIGGLPRERLPLVVGLLALTAGLVIIAVVQLRREAELGRLRADFVSGVSHELRTPLAQIRMFTETLLLGRVRSEAEGRRSLEIIARESQRLGQLVENVLFFARSERRTPQLARQSTRLAPIVAEVVENFAPLASAQQVRIVTALDDCVFANVDGGAVRQMLLNLLDNAVKYGPAGQTVVVRLTIDGDRARLLVQDEGPGIDARDAERVWEPFVRLEREAATTGGTGIGLAIVRRLAELHGGRAWVEPAARGAAVAIEVPGAWSAAGAAAVA